MNELFAFCLRASSQSWAESQSGKKLHLPETSANGLQVVGDGQLRFGVPSNGMWREGRLGVAAIGASAGDRKYGVVRVVAALDETESRDGRVTYLLRRDLRLCSQP
ncbi:MAG: hypothetical protein KME27_22135 [Lyngbya sp. HA4199-MV5]|jgi:hypothetical protein|nr:hypothetical protein [Lyngbya sp. HA4199-MV5]